MFGLFFLVAVIICRIGYMITVAHDNHEWNKNGEELAKENGWDNYLLCDREHWYDMNTGKVYHYEYDDHGDVWKTYGKKHVENMSEKKRKETIDYSEMRERVRKEIEEKYRGVEL